MNSYYLTVVLKPETDDSERKAFLDSVIKKMTGSEGKVEKEDLWGIKTLSYPIKRQTKGYYAHYEVQADPKDAKTIDKTLKVEEDVLRYLLIRR